MIGGFIELLCKSNYTNNDFNKPIEIVLNYLPNQELNQEEDVFLSDLIKEFNQIDFNFNFNLIFRTLL